MHNKPKKDAEWYKKQFELFEDLQAMCEAGGWELDLKTGMTSWSKQVYVIHGLSPDTTQLNKVDAISFYAEHERPRLIELLEKALYSYKRLLHKSF